MWPYTRRLTVLAAYLLPIAYTGLILGVVTHELLGHGLTAILLGGHFKGFVIKPDGMGWATVFATRDAPDWHEVVILTGGVLATLIVGVILLGLAFVCRRSMWLCTLFIVLAGETLLDSAAYTFWSALSPGTVGDAARIVELTGSTAAHVILATFGALLTLVATVVPFKLLLDAVEPWLARGEQPVTTQRVIAIVVLFLIPMGVGYYGFDWNQLIEGVGFLPAHANLVLIIFVAIAFWFWPRRWMAVDTCEASAVLPISIAWLVGIAMALVTAFWLSNGVSW